jgi:multicomponent Na+:H+ antiporter subunit D
VSWIPPLVVAVPLLAAALIAGGDHVVPRRVQDAVGVAAAAATTALSAVLLARVEHAEAVHWFGGWHPRGNVALGIDFAVDPYAAGLCAVMGGVVTIALVYSWTYLREEARVVDALLLVALAAMCGFSMSGDLFDLFVWLELMGVAAYALTGFQARKLGPVQGAFNFAITNTVGGVLLVLGIALLSARTGALNLAQIGATLAHGPAGGVVVVAMTLVVCGFLVKAAVVPFHLWAADAYAVAPAPVCAVIAGVMTDIGLLGVARTYWTIFDAPFGGGDVGDVLLWLGIVTAALAAVMALFQRHLKRLLAYSVISHIGMMLTGIGLLSSQGLAGAALVFVAHAFLTAALFLVAGVLHADHETIDELRLRGLGSRALGAVWLVATAGLIGAPYLGAALGHDLLDTAAGHQGRAWVPPVLWAASAVTGGALLRAGGRIFLGWGVDDDPLLGRAMDEEPPTTEVVRPLLVSASAVAAALGVVVSLVPGLAERAEYGADRFRGRVGYVRRVLHGEPLHPPPLLHTGVHVLTTETLLYAVTATLAAVAVAAVALHRPRLPRTVGFLAERTVAPPVALLKSLHSGVVGDYVTWVVVGTAVVGGVWTVLLHG